MRPDREATEEELPYSFGARLLLFVAAAVIIWVIAADDTGGDDAAGVSPLWRLIGLPAIVLALGCIAWDWNHRTQYRRRETCGGTTGAQDQPPGNKKPAPSGEGAG